MSGVDERHETFYRTILLHSTRAGAGGSTAHTARDSHRVYGIFSVSICYRVSVLCPLLTIKRYDYETEK